ncbi:hypothetical protein PSP31121_05447 [Pandoraea sputorum]|uniref:Uncharacterized protein n=1 Tax=Pandoraea sputorum TaxID=93222 RepID=A0A5E5BKM5_9BURK|nr:hypothetical protein PSP31121_05447 [Pandoraea sputorum]
MGLFGRAINELISCPGRWREADLHQRVCFWCTVFVDTVQISENGLFSLVRVCYARAQLSTPEIGQRSDSSAS